MAILDQTKLLLDQTSYDLMGMVCRWISVPGLVLFLAGAVYGVLSVCISNRINRR